MENKLGKDNRAGIDGSLYRISTMRSKSNTVDGLIYHVGRAVNGNAGLVKDIVQNYRF